MHGPIDIDLLVQEAYYAIVFLPLLGFFIAGIASLFSHRLAPASAADGAGHGAASGHPAHSADADAHHDVEASPHGKARMRLSEIATTGLLALSCLLSWVAFVDVGLLGNDMSIPLLEWITVANLQADWSLRIDTLTAVMLVVVTTVSALVHLYSIGYMHEDPHRPRFFAYLSLFTFAMLMLVTADNLVQMFFGWEGVGLASYLLIGFWYKKPSANAAAIKAFIVNRVGDFGFALGIFAVFVIFGSVNFDTIFAMLDPESGWQGGALIAGFDGLTVACLLLFMGAMGKSAQFLLHTWLPDAMEGPTPVSALIHAATMVTAGVFMVARLSPLFEHAPFALQIVTFIGATTAIFAASVGLVQNDIKRVIAYSTCSQLGYMFVALGLGAYNVAIFHLFTHAFFKALLFLGAGSVIHAMHHEQDIRRMGGIWRKIPFTYAMMIVGTLALTGFPFTAGYYSKDAIIEAAYATSAGHGGVAVYAFAMVLAAAAMTSFYSWRLVFLTFHGKSRADEKTLAHAHESPLTMTIPLGLLSVGALLAGVVFHALFISHEGLETFWREGIFLSPDNKILREMHHVPALVVWSPFIAMLVGFLIAWTMYIRAPGSADRLAGQHPLLYRFLLNKWYFDELYDWMFVRPAKRIGRFLWKTGDGRIIDGLGPDGISARILDVTRGAMRLQTGYLYHYAFAMLIGLALLFTWYMAQGMR